MEGGAIMPAQIIKVSQLNRYVRAQLEENTLLGDLLVKGELTSVSWRSSQGTSILPLVKAAPPCIV